MIKAPMITSVKRLIDCPRSSRARIVACIMIAHS
jgi:hypothetical protein